MEYKTKLSVKDFVSKSASGETGRLFGVARNVLKRSLPTGTRFEGLNGLFVWASVDDDGLDTIMADQLYLSDAMHGELSKLMTDPAKHLAFAFRLFREAKGGQPVLRFEVAAKPALFDPLEAMRASFKPARKK
jgi:hypothetical protein